MQSVTYNQLFLIHAQISRCSVAPRRYREITYYYLNLCQRTLKKSGFEAFLLGDKQTQGKIDTNMPLEKINVIQAVVQLGWYTGMANIRVKNTDKEP